MFDTNILIDYLNGKDQARAELARYTDRAISLVTWMEVMVGTTEQTAPSIRRFLSSFANLPVDDAVGEGSPYALRSATWAKYHGVRVGTRWSAFAMASHTASAGNQQEGYLQGASGPRIEAQRRGHFRYLKRSVSQFLKHFRCV